MSSESSEILVVMGTRPEAIKLGPVLLELASRGVPTRLVLTAQHRQMLDQVLDVFGVTADADLDIMRHGQSLSDIAVRALAGLDVEVANHRPRLLLVQGDTTSALAGAVAAFHRHVDIGHVEAGLRTRDLAHPFPEEANRQMIARIATLNFAPTAIAAANLKDECVPGAVHITGNTVIDALLSVTSRFDMNGGAPGVRRILVTAHRRENWGRPIANLCTAIERIVTEHENVEVVFSLHRNPAVREDVLGRIARLDRVRCVEALDYPQFCRELASCFFVITDSGGIQEEAPSLGKPVLVFRQTTERPEGVAAGVARIVGTEADGVFDAANTLLRDSVAYAAMMRADNPYGDGHASSRIVDVLMEHIGAGG